VNQRTAEPDTRRTTSRVLREQISSGSATCIPGVCDRDYCRHAPDCPWKRAIDEIYRIGRELDEELRALPDRQAKSCEDGGLKQEPDVNADLTESLDSGSDAAEDLWVSEGGSQAPHNYDVEDAND